MATDPKKSNVERQIDENLRRVYQDVVNQDLPDKFLDLIAKLNAEKRGQTHDE
ncbi:transcriptional regulator [Silicimonas algicola]|uniref:NepR family anti-sigma factor n=1 Tax=Silicimonas algicola TaxID=1826607 RepID=UPI000D6AC455|nr:NepR family anti-sigma factor [Silicimonas algicola]AZQ67379.1 transcriptional regulator [Silicimonas algicola]